MRLRRFVGIGFLAISLCAFPTTRSNRHPSQLRHRLTTRNKHYFLKSTFWKHNNFTIAHRISWDFFFLYTHLIICHTHPTPTSPSIPPMSFDRLPSNIHVVFISKPPHTVSSTVAIDYRLYFFFFPLLFLVLCKLDLSLFLISSCFRALFSNILLLLTSEYLRGLFKYSGLILGPRKLKATWVIWQGTVRQSENKSLQNQSLIAYHK